MGGGRRERKRREGNGERGRERGRKGGREKDQGPHCHFGADGLAGRGEGGLGVISCWPFLRKNGLMISWLMDVNYSYSYYGRDINFTSHAIREG